MMNKPWSDLTPEERYRRLGQIIAEEIDREIIRQIRLLGLDKPDNRPNASNAFNR